MFAIAHLYFDVISNNDWSTLPIARTYSGSQMQVNVERCFAAPFQSATFFTVHTSSMLSCSNRRELQMAIKPIRETPQTQWKHVGDLSTTRMMMLRAIANRLNIASPLVLSLPAAVLARRGRTQQTQ